MSYLVLARKWRPQTFDDILSQELIANTVKNAIITERIAHAYLFSGPRGVGKTTTARILAKALNCKSFDKPTPTPCDTCTSCVEIREGRSPDVLEIDGASNRSVDDIQPLRERVQYAPQGRYKVIIIDEVHMLTTHAFNALLKTLEEPPPNVVFVFATTEPEKIPATIISRCQRHDFKRIPTDKIKERLIQLAEFENLELDEDAALVIANKADGALRDGLSLFDQVIAYVPEGRIDRDKAARILGMLPRDAFITIAKSASESELLPMLNTISEILKGGISPNSLIEGIIDGYKEVMIDKLANENNPELAEISAKYAAKDFVRILRLLSETQSKMRLSKKPEFLLEEIMLYIGMMETTTEIENILKGLPDIAPKAFPSENPGTYAVQPNTAQMNIVTQAQPVQVETNTPSVDTPKVESTPQTENNTEVKTPIAAPISNTETQAVETQTVQTQEPKVEEKVIEDTEDIKKDREDIIDLFDAKPLN